MRAEAKGATHGGVHRSENVGMSNRKGRESRPHRKSKVSWAMVIIPGLVGPKEMAKAASDGHMVNIP